MLSIGDLEDGPLRARYALEGKIGRGGMGVVAEANDRRIGRQVAIKRLAGQPTPELVERFVHEARIQGRLDHPAILPVYDVGIQSDGRPYFVMRKVSGMTLAEIVHLQDSGDDGAIAEWPRRRLLGALLDVCLALAHAHGRGIVHRDLKPANVMLGDDGGVYVLDWGVATEIGTIGSLGAGTVGYMAPEQAEGGAVDARADVYAIGQMLREIVGDDPDLEALCTRATAALASARHAGARELAEELQAYLDADLDADLARQEASAHVARARAAASRGESMREAGLALALDPSSEDAAEIVQELLLEPPSPLPAEVQRALDAQDEALIRTRGWAAALSYLGGPLFVPLYLWQGVRDWRLVIAMPVLAAVLFGFALTAVTGRLPRSRLWIGAVGNVFFMWVFGRVCGPMAIPPAMAAAASMIICTHPTLRAWWLVVAILLCGPIGAAALEHWGVFAPTVSERGGELVLGSTMVYLPATATIAGLVLYIVAILVIAARFGHRMSAAHHSTRRALAVQAWHLRGLLGRKR